MSSFSKRGLNLRAMGFCGADDSVSPEHLQLLSIHYPWIEWGVLFRPDLEGTPRYATMAWVEQLCKINQDTGGSMRLAAHLCGSRCEEVVLQGDTTFLRTLSTLGFGRVQINATKANNVNAVQGDANNSMSYAQNLMNCVTNVPELEFIFQLNTETTHIWNEFIKIAENGKTEAGDIGEASAGIPSNLSVLYDASCGLGKLSTSYAAPLVINGQKIPSGYAGGIAPDNVKSVLENVMTASNGEAVWIDMESSLRTKVLLEDKSNPENNQIQDVFSMETCFKCVMIGTAHFPQTLPVSRYTIMSI